MNIAFKSKMLKVEKFARSSSYNNIWANKNILPGTDRYQIKPLSNCIAQEHFLILHDNNML